MNIAISGITGLVGSNLSEYLTSQGHTVTGLLREDFARGTTHLAEKLKGMDAVVHLAGASIIKRWTPKWKETIYHSRIDTTSKLVSAINGMIAPPGIFVSASAVDIYDTFDVHDEFSTVYADDFLSDVCIAWEREAMKINHEKVRLSIIRMGMVLSAKGGALKKMLSPFKLGLGAKIGDGLQPMPYIHISDLTRAIEWIISREDAKGIFNLVAPEIVSNVEFTKALSSALNRPALFTIPEFMLKLIYGEGASVLINGQKVISKRLEKEGFQFEFPDLASSLYNLLKKS